MEQAEVRRKELEEEKVKTVLERSGLDRHNRLRSASAYQREKQFSATVAKRQQQLQEIRDRLKDKHKKNEMVRLKKQLQNGGDGTPTKATATGLAINGGPAATHTHSQPPLAAAAGGTDSFFDD